MANLSYEQAVERVATKLTEDFRHQKALGGLHVWRKVDFRKPASTLAIIFDKNLLAVEYALELAVQQKVDGV